MKGDPSRSMPVAARIAAAVAAALLLLLPGCGDDDAGTTTVAATGTAAPELPPITYVISLTGLYRGEIEAIGNSTGTIRFALTETDASTHATLADGQVVVYDYEITALEVALSLHDHPCGDTTLSGDFLILLGEPMGVDADSRFSAETESLQIHGSTYQGASGGVTVFVTPAGSDGACPYGPVSWSAGTG